MALNFTALQNLTPLNFSTANLTDVNNMVPNMINTTNASTQSYLGLGILISVFLVLVFTIFRDDGDIRMDITRSIMLSSGFCSILGIVLLISNIIGSFIHVMWFIGIFAISLVSTYMLKKKGM